MSERVFHFAVKPEGCDEQVFSSSSSIYEEAALQAFVMLSLPIPSKLEIWVPEFLPNYGPYTYELSRKFGVLCVDCVGADHD